MVVMLLPLDQGDSLIVGLIWKEWMMVVDNNHVEFHDQTWPVLETNKKKKLRCNLFFCVQHFVFHVCVPVGNCTMEDWILLNVL